MTKGSIYLVATPLGNLEDITLRALRILREVDLVACEDTRRTGRLLQHFEISKPLVSCYDQNEARRARQLADRAASGESIALVCDAGTPGIADPGYRVVQAAIEAGVTVVPLPGPNAAIAALAASGLPTHEFVFKGFLPARGNKRRSVIRAIRGSGRTTVFYESPHRILRTLSDLSELLGDRRVVAVRELSKMFEEILRGTAASIQEELERRPAVKGEFVLLVGPAESTEELSVATLEGTAERLARADESATDALEKAAAECGISPVEARRLIRRQAKSEGGATASVRSEPAESPRGGPGDTDDR